jgi:hypothetical protein
MDADYPTRPAIIHRYSINQKPRKELSKTSLQNSSSSTYCLSETVNQTTLQLPSPKESYMSSEVPMQRSSDFGEKSSQYPTGTQLVDVPNRMATSVFWDWYSGEAHHGSR